MDPRKAEILQVAREIGFDAVGIASAETSRHGTVFDVWLAGGGHADMRWLARDPERRKDPDAFLPGARSVIVVGLNYWLPDPPPQPGMGRVARYARGADYHGLMRRMLRELGQRVEALGGPGVQARGAVDSSPIFEREPAARAGVGWIGRNTMLLSRTFGPWLLLGEVVTTLEIPPDTEARDHCGSCTRCLDACPTDAFTVPRQLDARRCLSWMSIEARGDIPEEHRAAMGDRLFGCDACLDVCPWTRFSKEAGRFRETARGELAQLDPRVLLTMDEAGFCACFAGTPIKRLGLERLQRNACVVLGNIGTPADRALLTTVAQTHASELVRRHAEWALSGSAVATTQGRRSGSRTDKNRT